MTSVALVRWGHGAGTSLAEEERRRELETKIAAFWAAFVERSDALRELFARRVEWDLPAFMNETLGAIDPALMWEYGPAVRGSGHRLVITPEGRKDLRPLVGAILARAPELAGWELYAHRLAESPQMARQSVQARCRHPGTLAEVTVTRGEHHLLDSKFSGANAGEDDDDALHEAYVLSETLLGERVLDSWIGEIAVQPRRRGILGRLGLGSVPADAIPVSALEDRVTSEVERIRDRAHECECRGRERDLVAAEARTRESA